MFGHGTNVISLNFNLITGASAACRTALFESSGDSVEATRSEPESLGNSHGLSLSSLSIGDYPNSLLCRR